MVGKLCDIATLVDFAVKIELVDKLAYTKHIVDMDLKCSLQTWVDVVSSSTAYLNILFNFPEKTTTYVIDYYYQTWFVLHAALLFHLAVPRIRD